MRRILKWGWIFSNIVLAIATIFSGFGDSIDPQKWVIPSMAAMAYPAFWLATVFVGIINLFINKKYSLIQLASLLVTVGAFWSFCPLNFFHASTDGKQSFEIMTYNVYDFEDVNDEYPDEINRTMSQIIASDVDFVFIQETGPLLFQEKGRFQAQIDSIKERYPYINIGIEKQRGVAGSCILSKHPLTPISLRQPKDEQGCWSAAKTCIDGDTLLLVSVHLKSICYLPDEREVYQQLINKGGNIEDKIKEAKRTLYPKLAYAFRERSSEVKLLRQQLDSINAKNIILAGDFNEIERGYAMKTISGGEMHSAFSKAALGPMITYYKDRFYFNIDHILYQGNLKAVKIRRGSVKSSDHYPVYATFVIE